MINVSILKTIKSAAYTRVIILTYGDVIYFVYISIGLHFAQERFNKTCAPLRTSD